MSTTKNKYNFYLSYWESFKVLTTDKEKVEFITLINKIHFFEEHIDRIEIKSPNVKLLFASIKHSLKASIQGYCDKKQIGYDSIFDTPLEPPLQGGSIDPLEPPCEQLIINNKQYIINNEKNTKKFFPPNLEEVKNYCLEKSHCINPEKFVNFYTSKGWKVGSQPMEDWKSSVDLWAGNEANKVVKQYVADLDTEKMDLKLKRYVRDKFHIFNDTDYCLDWLGTLKKEGKGFILTASSKKIHDNLLKCKDFFGENNIDFKMANNE